MSVRLHNDERHLYELVWTALLYSVELNDSFRI